MVCEMVYLWYFRTEKNVVTLHSEIKHKSNDNVSALMAMKIHRLRDIKNRRRLWQTTIRKSIISRRYSFM